jgi:hypothetical protein
MMKLIKFSVFAGLLLTVATFTACTEIPQFEGYYVGTFTIEYMAEGIDVPPTGDALILIERNFKDITVTYRFYTDLILTCKIDDGGRFTTSREYIDPNGVLVKTVDQGRIVYTTGIFTSVLTEEVGGVEMIRINFVLQKQFIDIEN